MHLTKTVVFPSQWGVHRPRSFAPNWMAMGPKEVISGILLVFNLLVLNSKNEYIPIISG